MKCDVAGCRCPEFEVSTWNVKRCANCPHGKHIHKSKAKLAATKEEEAKWQERKAAATAQENRPLRPWEIAAQKLEVERKKRLKQHAAARAAGDFASKKARQEREARKRAQANDSNQEARAAPIAAQGYTGLHSAVDSEDADVAQSKTFQKLAQRLGTTSRNSRNSRPSSAVGSHDHTPQTSPQRKPVVAPASEPACLSLSTAHSDRPPSPPPGASPVRNTGATTPPDEPSAAGLEMATEAAITEADENQQTETHPEEQTEAEMEAEIEALEALEAQLAQTDQESKESLQLEHPAEQSEEQPQEQEQSEADNNAENRVGLVELPTTAATEQVIQATPTGEDPLEPQLEDQTDSQSNEPVGQSEEPQKALREDEIENQVEATEVNQDSTTVNDAQMAGQEMEASTTSHSVEVIANHISVVTRMSPPGSPHPRSEEHTQDQAEPATTTDQVTTSGMEVIQAIGEDTTQSSVTHMSPPASPPPRPASPPPPMTSPPGQSLSPPPSNLGSDAASEIPPIPKSPPPPLPTASGTDTTPSTASIAAAATAADVAKRFRSMQEQIVRLQADKQRLERDNGFLRQRVVRAEALGAKLQREVSDRDHLIASLQKTKPRPPSRQAPRRPET